MEESLQCSHNLQRHSRMCHESILVRAYATAQRHTCNAHTPIEGVGAAPAIGLDSSGSPGALSVPCAHSTAPAALDGPPRCSELYASKAPAVACPDQLRCGGLTRTVGAGEPVTSELVQDHHSRRS